MRTFSTIRHMFFRSVSARFPLGVRRCRSAASGLLTLVFCFGTPGRADIGKRDVQDFIAHQAGTQLSCEKFHDDFRRQLPEDPGQPSALSRQTWVWPAFFLNSADPNCPINPLPDAPLARLAATALLDDHETGPALLVGFLGACCYMRVHQDRKAQAQLEWLRDQRTTTFRLVQDDPIWPLVDQCSVYTSMQGLVSVVRSAHTRPAIVVAGFQVSDCPDLDDVDAASAAITWMVYREHKTGDPGPPAGGWKTMPGRRRRPRSALLRGARVRGEQSIR